MHSQFNPGFFKEEGVSYREKAKKEFNCDIPKNMNEQEYYITFYGQFYAAIHSEQIRAIIKNILFLKEISVREFEDSLLALVKNNCYLVLDQILKKYSIDQFGGDLLTHAVTLLKPNILDVLITNEIDINSTSLSLILCALKDLGKDTEAKLEIIKRLLECKIDVDSGAKHDGKVYTARETCSRICNNLSTFDFALRKELGLQSKNVREINAILDVLEKVVNAPKVQPSNTPRHSK